MTFAQLLGRYPAATAALDAIPDLARRGGWSEPLRVPSPAAAEAELEAATRLGARLIAAFEPDLPSLLAALDPPRR